MERITVPSHLKYCNSTKKLPVSSKYIYVHELLIKHLELLLIWYFHSTAWLNWFLCFFCVLFCSFLIIVFLCLCFYAFVLCIFCSIGNIVTIVSYHRRPARWITPFWQPAYPLHLYLHYILFMANKLCCWWCLCLVRWTIATHQRFSVPCHVVLFPNSLLICVRH